MITNLLHRMDKGRLFSEMPPRPPPSLPKSYEVRDIYWAIVDYDHHLWIAFDGDEIKGAVVTNIAQYPRKRYLCMSFCGGIELEKWKDPMLKMLQHWAFDNRCDGIEATARPGWAKIFKNDGHVPLWHTFELPSGSKGLKNG